MLLFFILISFHFKTKIVANRPRIRSYVIWVILSLIVSYNVLMPSISTFYYQRGNSHLRNNNVTVSIENLSKALKCDKYNPYNYTKLAELYTYKYSVSKLDNDLSSLLKSTFIGGDSFDVGYSIDFDGDTLLDKCF